MTIPAAVVGIVVSSFVVNRLGKELAEDPEVQAKIARGELAPPRSGAAEVKADVTVTAAGRNAAIIFLLGVAVIVLFGLFLSLIHI